MHWKGSVVSSQTSGSSTPNCASLDFTSCVSARVQNRREDHDHVWYHVYAGPALGLCITFRMVANVV